MPKDWEKIARGYAVKTQHKALEIAQYRQQVAKQQQQVEQTKQHDQEMQDHMRIGKHHE